MTAGRWTLTPLIVSGILSACAGLTPLREPPLLASEESIAGLTTRAEAIAHFGPPMEVRVSDLGEVLVYRRVLVAEANPNRYFGEDRGTRFDRYERVLLYLDGSGRIVRWVTQPE